jgi:hypothetical protein
MKRKILFFMAMVLAALTLYGCAYYGGGYGYYDNGYGYYGTYPYGRGVDRYHFDHDRDRGNGHDRDHDRR